MKWNPMETAPRDGSKVTLLVELATRYGSADRAWTEIVHAQYDPSCDRFVWIGPEGQARKWLPEGADFYCGSCGKTRRLVDRVHVPAGRRNPMCVYCAERAAVNSAKLVIAEIKGRQFLASNEQRRLTAGKAAQKSYRRGYIPSVARS